MDNNHEIEVMRNSLEAAIKGLLSCVYTRNIRKNEVIKALLVAVLDRHRAIVRYMANERQTVVAPKLNESIQEIYKEIEKP